MKSQLIVLMSYLVIFGIVTIIGILDYFGNIVLVDLGLPTRITNGIIIFLGIAGIIKTLIYIIIYERKK